MLALKAMKKMMETLSKLVVYTGFYEWSLHMKFMKQTFGKFHKFYMKWPLI